MKIILIGCICIVASCAAHKKTLYETMGGQTAIEKIVEYFIAEIEFDSALYPYFKDSNVSRFRKKFIEHLCATVGGPCVYTGDSMIDVHSGMHISESHFNQTVDVLIIAMTKTNISHPIQNRILARLAPMRKDIIYK